MSWKIQDIVVDPVTSDIKVTADFDVAGVKKSDVIMWYSGDHGLTQEEFYNRVVGNLNDSNTEAIKDQVTKDAEKQAKKDAKKTEADDFVAANTVDADYKLKNLKDTDV